MKCKNCEAVIPEVLRLVKEREAARFLGTTAGTLRQDRASGNPKVPYVRLFSRGIRYDLSDLEGLIEASRVRGDRGRAPVLVALEEDSGETG